MRDREAVRVWLKLLTVRTLFTGSQVNGTLLPFKVTLCAHLAVPSRRTEDRGGMSWYPPARIVLRSTPVEPSAEAVALNQM